MRLGDHAGLVAAARFGAVVPMLVVDPELERTLASNPRRAAYYCGAVSSLRAALAERGVALGVRRGTLVPSVLRVARALQARAVTWSASYDAASIARERALQAALEEAGIHVRIVHDAPAIAPEETAAIRASDGGAGYRALAPYVSAWRTVERASYGGRVTFADPEPSSEALPSASDFGARGDAEEAPTEASVLAAFDAYLASAALGYRAARNVPAHEATSRLSAALSFGVVSARVLLDRIEMRRRDRFLLVEERASLDALARALAQRDFFLQLGWFFGEADVALQPRMRAFPFARTHPQLAAWAEGRTGFPLVDAGMRQLRATGWMHPRVRLVAASFLCFDLGVDWRVGREAWADLLIEDDDALATGNWQWSAGVGADLAQFPRIFNPRRQARWFDPAGAYVRHWIPELAGLPDAAVLDPQASARRRQLSLPLFDGASYPAPILDHEAAARAFLGRYAAFVREAAR